MVVAHPTPTPTPPPRLQAPATDTAHRPAPGKRTAEHSRAPLRSVARPRRACKRKGKPAAAVPRRARPFRGGGGGSIAGGRGGLDRSFASALKLKPFLSSSDPQPASQPAGHTLPASSRLVSSVLFFGPPVDRRRHRTRISAEFSVVFASRALRLLPPPARR